MSILVTRSSAVGAVSGNWATKIADSGVIFATDFSEAGMFTEDTHVFGESGPNEAYWKTLVTHYTGDSRLSSALKINSPAATGCNGSGWYTSLNPGGFPGTATLGGAWTANAQGLLGIPFYVQMRVKFPASRFMVGAQRDGHPYQGWKYFDVSAYSPVDPSGQSASNTQFECVGQVQKRNRNDLGWDAPFSYHQPGYASFYETYYGNLVDGDQGYFYTTRRDNGAGELDPSNRYCLMGSSDEKLSEGCYRFTADQWHTIDIYINCQTLDGTTGNEYKMWITNQDSTTRVQLYNETGVYWGQDSEGRFTQGHCGLWLNAYESAADFPSGADTYQLWSQVIVSLNPIVLPTVGS